MSTLHVYYLETNLICMMFMAFVLYSYVRESNGLDEAKWFIASIIGVQIYCLSDILAAFFKKQVFTGARLILEISNTVYITTPLILVIIWQRYSREHMSRFYDSEKEFRLFERVSLYLAIATCTLSLSSPITHFSFYLDELNGYHRGLGAYLVPAVSYIFLFYELIKARIIARKSQEPQVRTESLTMSLLPIPCILFSGCQLFFYGITTAQVGFTMGYMIVYLNRQQNSISRDVLTGINNRRQFEFACDKLSGTNADVLVAMIDVDGLKHVNDTYGHVEGDEMLKATAKILHIICTKSSLPGNFKEYRFGGDEFIILSSSFNQEKAEEALVSEINKAISEFNSTNRFHFELSMSVGVAYNNLKAEELHQIISRADEKMYNLKKSKKYSREL